jgi:RNA polymerase subunit RPABC4/transcription elongation factor Spt4
MPPATTTKTCPNCAAATTGRYCPECGAAVTDAACAGCRSLLSPGAKFCHRCGTAVGTLPARTAEPRTTASALPWAVAAIALLALVALVAGQRFGGTRAASTATQSSADGGAPTGGSPPGAARAPDISNLSPRERADRLYDRVMRLSSEGKTDSVQFFSPMALSVYQDLGPLDADLRYDFGRVAEASGAAGIATAQADTILAADSTHLLGLVLGIRAAELRGDSAAARSFARRLLVAEPAESAKRLPEYQRHQGDILEALAEARRK